MRVFLTFYGKKMANGISKRFRMQVYSHPEIGEVKYKSAIAKTAIVAFGVLFLALSPLYDPPYP